MRLDDDNVVRVVERIEADIADRRGLKHEWRAIDEDIRSEIKAEWAQIVAEQFVKLRLDFAVQLRALASVWEESGAGDHINVVDVLHLADQVSGGALASIEDHSRAARSLGNRAKNSALSGSEYLVMVAAEELLRGEMVNRVGLADTVGVHVVTFGGERGWGPTLPEAFCNLRGTRLVRERRGR